MLDIMSQAKNAMQAYSTKLQAITSNISNLSVPGYKRTDITFEEMYSRMIKSATSPDSGTGNSGGTNSVQTGGSAGVASSNIDFTVGQMQGGGNLDVGISDPGKLFIVSPDGGKTFLYTRAGEFQVLNNKLVTSSGQQVYGFRTSGGISSNSLEAIDLSSTAYDSASLTFDVNGVLTDKNGSLSFQLALTTFPNLSGLQYTDGTSFAQSLASGSAAQPFAPTGGIIVPKSKEASNVQYTSEVIDSIEIQRALDANLTVVRLVSDVIANFISKLG